MIFSKRLKFPTLLSIANSDAKSVAINVEKVAPFMRVGLKANTPAAGDSVNVWAVGEMLQAK